ncbi:hypothetical protein Q4488_14605 [Amphritea sp. 1_MG-2023]|nr:hypothetical protein [Amphritea sp. 1_MG-2023]MDO6564615.1 hypothetical protein [Amphritea sp. 1_MG-2023]
MSGENNLLVMFLSMIVDGKEGDVALLLAGITAVNVESGTEFAGKDVAIN